MKYLTVKRQLMMYFIITLLFTVSILYLQQQSYQYTIQLQQAQSEETSTLNLINQQTKDVFRELEWLLEEPSMSNQTEVVNDLTQYEQVLETFREETDDQVILLPLKRYMPQFIDLVDKTIENVNQETVAEYVESFREAETRTQYIEDDVVYLLNETLSRYQTVAELEEQRLALFNRLIFILTVLSVSILTMIAMSLSRRITRPLEDLTTSAEALAKGDYQLTQVNGGDVKELAVLADSFNLMRYNIVEAIKEMKEKARMRELLREMKIKSLQNQIQPHFLFNTLNVISRTAYLENAKDTERLIQALSGLLRHNIGDLDQLTTIEKEVESVRKYFSIQTARFGDRFKFIEHVDERCLKEPIPPLTLQPLIENAVIHGIDSLEDKGRVDLRISCKNDQLIIGILDNGVGMTDEEVKRLKDTTKAVIHTKGHSTGLGLTNVRERLRYYHPAMIFDINSSPNQGTQLKITLPLKPTKDEEL